MAKTELAEWAPQAIENIDALSFGDLGEIGAEVGFATLPGFTNTDQLDLLGIPFVVTGIRFQAPITDKGRDGGWRDYLTVEATVADRETLTEAVARKRITKGTGRNAVVIESVNELFVTPGERIVINDGSTGIRRQLVTILDKAGIVRVGHSDNEKRMDLSWNQWDDAFLTPQQWVAADGTVLPYITHRADGKPFLLMCRRGLHASDYSNEYGENTTFYLG